MTGKDDDYNFVFKGKLGIMRREGSREGGREAVSRGDRVSSCVLSLTWNLGEKAGLRSIGRTVRGVDVRKLCSL